MAQILYQDKGWIFFASNTNNAYYSSFIFETTHNTNCYLILSLTLLKSTHALMVFSF